MPVEFIYDSARKMMAITSLHNQYEINSILYTGAVGIERLQKIYLCLEQHNPADMQSMPKCLLKHNHTELEKEIEKYTLNILHGTVKVCLACLLNTIIIFDMQITCREDMTVG